MQTGVTPGAVLELHAARANGGTGPGINSPPTTTWTDTSGNGNGGTLHNFAYTAASGWAGTGAAGDPYRLVEDGIDDYVGLPFLNATGGKVFSLEAWVYTPASAPGNYIFAVGEMGPTVTTYPLATLGVQNASGRAFIYYRDSASHTIYTYGPGTVNICDAGLHHLVATSDGTTVYVWMDGVRGISGTPPSVATVMNASRVGEGANNQYPWLGSIAAARIYPFSLTAAQVAQNYAAGPTW